MAVPIEFGDTDYFMNMRAMGREGIVIMNCDVSQYQALFNLGLVRAGDVGWNTGGGVMNFLNMILLREEYRRGGALDAQRLVDVPIPKIKAAIQFLVEHGIDINFSQESDEPLETPDSLVSFGTPIEIALYKRQYDMVQFLRRLGANPPRPHPFLAEARDGLRQWVSIKTAYNSGRKSTNNFSTMPRNVLGVIGSMVSGKTGGRRTRRRRL